MNSANVNEILLTKFSPYGKSATMSEIYRATGPHA